MSSWFRGPRGARWFLLVATGFLAQCGGCFELSASDGESGCAPGPGLHEPCSVEEPCDSFVLFGPGLTCVDGVCLHPCSTGSDCIAPEGCRHGGCQSCEVDEECAALHTCEELGCTTISCVQDEDCPPEAHCEWTCVADEEIGGFCDDHPGCLTDNCVDGVCCPVECTFGCLDDVCIEPHGTPCEPSLCDTNPSGELRVHDDAQRSSAAIAANGAGDLVVVWEEQRPVAAEIEHAIEARIFPATGGFLDATVATWTQTSPLWNAPVVAMGRDRVVVAWRIFDDSDPADVRVRVRRFDLTGALLGVESGLTFTEPQGSPAVAMDDDGRYFLVWTSGAWWVNEAVWGQHFDAAGDADGAEGRVSTFEGAQSAPAVAMNASGAAVVVWESFDQVDEIDIFARRYDADGAPSGGELAINEFTTGFQYDPAVAMDDRGEFAVSWTGYGHGGAEGAAVLVRRFAADGIALSFDELVNEYTLGDQDLSAIAIDASGDVVVAWHDVGLGLLSENVFRRRLDPVAGWGDETQVNGCACYGAFGPRVVTANGNAVVIWLGRLAEDGTAGLFGQQFDDSGAALGLP